MATQTLARPNRYAAKCVRCGGHIPAGEGLLVKTDTGWAADHPAACPDKPTGAAIPVKRVDHDGIYRADDGTIYKVQIAKQGSGQLYAKRLEVTTTSCGGCENCDGEDRCPRHTAHFEYAPGAIHRLRADQRVSAEEAAKFGSLYGICMACGRDLTDENSIAAGIGPICASKYF